jgi:hypothetical protein
LTTTNEDATPLLTGMLLAELYEDDAGDLAPAYKDDVGCFMGCSNERPWGGLLMTLLLYLLFAVLITSHFGLLPWFTISGNEFRSVFFVCYGVYMIENLGSSTSSYLWRLNGHDEDGRVRVRAMLDRPPWIRWTLHNYHYPTAAAAEQGNPANRIRTSTMRGEYAIFGCADATTQAPFTSHQLCKLTFKMERDWKDQEALERYNSAKAQFTEENKKDTHTDLIESWGIDGWQKHMTVVRAGRKMPEWASWLYFLVISLCGMGVWYRIYFAARTGSRTVTVTKVLW